MGFSVALLRLELDFRESDFFASDSLEVDFASAAFLLASASRRASSSARLRAFSISSAIAPNSLLSRSLQQIFAGTISLVKLSLQEHMN